MPKLNEQQQTELSTVVSFVTKAHSAQFRKGSGVPYVSHPFSVLKIICNWGITDSVLFKVALSHDVLEDCPEVSFEQLQQILGPEAAGIVQELTFTPDKNSQIPVPAQKAIYMEGIANKSLQALVIKLADRIDNTLDFCLEDRKYANKYWCQKAQTLFQAFGAKKSKITEIYGEKTLYLMEKTIFEVEQKLKG